MEQVRPFLESVLEGAKIPQARFDDVMRHYKVFNGISPYNEITQKQKAALENWFRAAGEPIPVYIGLRHASPSFKETFEAMKRDKVNRVIGFVLAPFRCFTSFEKYIHKLEEGRAAAGASVLEVTTLDHFSDHPSFLEAQTDKIKKILAEFSADERERTFFLFSAHSIPVEMSEQSAYADQFLRASSSIAKRLALKHWDCGYQSRSGNPSDPWLAPDVKEIIQKIDSRVYQNVVIIPIGFVCDNVEVLYDLDIETKEAVRGRGLHYFRASTVTDHPKFIEMIGVQALRKIKQDLLWV